MNYNKVIIAGHLSRDPELSVMPSGDALCVFGVATNERWKNKDGTQGERVCFVEVKAFRAKAETVAKFFTKGKGILVEGKLRLDQWEAKDGGGKRSKLYVVLDNFEFVGGKDNDPASGSGEPSAGMPSRDDDEIPF
jgi:single-strand DNA-binding protein